MDDKYIDGRGSENQIEGKNPVFEALRSGRTIEKIFIMDGNQDVRVQEILKRASRKRITIQKLDKDEIEQVSKTHVHQGVIAITTPYQYSSIDEIMKRAQSMEDSPFIVVLDHIKDPHNFGAIIRTAEACGVHGIIIPKMRAVGITPTVVKASAGAVEHIPI